MPSNAHEIPRRRQQAQSLHFALCQHMRLGGDLDPTPPRTLGVGGCSLEPCLHGALNRLPRHSILETVRAKELASGFDPLRTLERLSASGTFLKPIEWVSPSARARFLHVVGCIESGTTAQASARRNVSGCGEEERKRGENDQRRNAHLPHNNAGQRVDWRKTHHPNGDRE